MNAVIDNGRGARTSQAPLLEVKGLSVAYGKAQVVHDVAFEVRRGEFAVLLGRNGAGKTTILQAISALLPRRGGQLRFDGADVSAKDAPEMVHAGMIHVLEGHRVFTTLTVEDNLLLGTFAKNRRGDRSKLDRIYDLFPILAEKRHLPAAKLSGGQQQILAVAQGVIGEPQLLILDEPSRGLAPIIVDQILQVARQLCDTGIAVLLVEQLVHEALKYGDYCYLLDTGRISGEGVSSEMQRGTLLQRAFLGH
ncbi:ABC transporter ATP-binding protein [Burkholderia sp. KK1]|nr:ABC transporter ATP-binding protein [Burkholderia sp. KK1]